ncbi:MAG: Gfo/Idh/MocA family oxidoreductase [Lachnospiraceae bacterium]|nr:Gfo/Idh/MocA family oxidoreductase [Lachnospiraceae bacterium]
MSERFRWCFIGCGTLAKIVAEQLNASGRHEIVSVYARRFEASTEFANTFGGKAYKTAEEAISADDVDGVYIVTPHRSHAEYSKIAINLGKPVLCEKPFTINLKETREVIDLAREKGVYITEAMWTWFSPVGARIK